MPLFEYDVAKRVVGNVKRLALVGCERCGVAHSHPLPSAETVQAFYAGDDGWTRRIDAPDGELDVKTALKRKKRRKDFGRIAAHVAAPGSVLDFGCGPGGFLDLLQEHGWRTYGIELAEQDRAYASRRHEMLDEIPQAPTYNLVVAYHVLEHLAEPNTTVRALAQALQPDGYLYVSVPDAGAVHLHGKLRHIANSIHIFTYTEAGLRSLFALNGLARVDAWHKGHRLQMLGRRVTQPLTLPAQPLEELRAALRSYVEPQPAASPAPSLMRRIASKFR